MLDPMLPLQCSNGGRYASACRSFVEPLVCAHSLKESSRLSFLMVCRTASAVRFTPTDCVADASPGRNHRLASSILRKSSLPLWCFHLSHYEALFNRNARYDERSHRLRRLLCCNTNKGIIRVVSVRIFNCPCQGRARHEHKCVHCTRDAKRPRS